MLYNSNDKTIDTAKELEKEYNGKSKVIAKKCPVDDSKAVAEVIAKCAEEFGRIDVFVANAGMGCTHTMSTSHRLLANANASALQPADPLPR